MRTRQTPGVVALLLTAALVVGAPAAPAHASRSTDNRDRMLHLINATRVKHGRRPLRLNVALSRSAWEHSYRMWESGTLYHTSNLSGRVVNSWGATCWGEDLGMGSSLRQIRRMWMHSAPHRANMLSRRFTHIGIGIVQRGTTYWVTADFYG